MCSFCWPQRCSLCFNPQGLPHVRIHTLKDWFEDQGIILFMIDFTSNFTIFLRHSRQSFCLFYSSVPGRMPALFHSVDGVLCDRFHPGLHGVCTLDTGGGKGQKVREYGRLQVGCSAPPLSNSLKLLLLNKDKHPSVALVVKIPVRFPPGDDCA